MFHSFTHLPDHLRNSVVGTEATTVAATMRLAHAAGIATFVTGEHIFIY